MQKRKSLRRELDRFFEVALETANATKELRELAGNLAKRREKLNQPMRVAFIGGVNNGKSTLMNAFLGEKLAETGNRELTWNVTWFRYGDRPQLRVHTSDGGVEYETFSSLTALTTRCEQNHELSDRIRYVEVSYPAEMLKRFDLIDTPGLYSSKKKDSENTRKFLVDENTRPHAIVFLFSDTLKAHDIEELDAFRALHAGAVTGVNAICALTKADTFPMGIETAQRVIDQIRNDHPWTLQRFYTILPVMGQPAFGAATITDEEKNTLVVLASLPAETTRKMLLDAGLFETKEYADGLGVPSPAARVALMERIGLWGIRFALHQLRGGSCMPQTMAAMVFASNVDRLREIVVSHFGNRGFLIQASAALDAVRNEAFGITGRLRGNAQAAAYKIVTEVDEIRRNEARFREFAILEKYYSSDVTPGDEDLKQLLDATGERGGSCAERLGAAAGTAPAQLMTLAADREAYWRGRSSDYWASEDFKEMARTMAQLYGEIHGRVGEAAAHLQAAAELLDWHL